MSALEALLSWRDVRTPVRGGGRARRATSPAATPPKAFRHYCLQGKRGGLPGACRSLERPASVLVDRLSRPELDEGVATALGLRIEHPRAVADLDLFDGQLGFQLDRTK